MTTSIEYAPRGVKTRIVSILGVVVIALCGCKDERGGEKNASEKPVTQDATGPSAKAAAPTTTNEFVVYYNQNGRAVDEESSSLESGRTPEPLANMASTKCKSISPTRPSNPDFERLFEVGTSKRKIKGSGKLAEQFSTDGMSQGYICVKDNSDNDKWTDILPLDANRDDGHACTTAPYLCQFTYNGVTYCRRC